MSLISLPMQVLRLASGMESASAACIMPLRNT